MDKWIGRITAIAGLVALIGGGAFSAVWWASDVTRRLEFIESVMSESRGVSDKLDEILKEVQDHE